MTALLDLPEPIRQALNLPRLTPAAAYRNGYNAGRDGTTDTNCHFANFARPELTAAWQRGNDDAKDGRPCTP
jgi:hypothetical protein